MKRLYPAIISLFLLSLLYGCGADQYAIEKRYWTIQKQAERIFKNPHASPPQELERAVKSFNSFIQQYPSSILAVDAEFSIARLYAVKEEYGQSRGQLRAIINKPSKSPNIAAEALFMIGNSYEIEGKWSLALEQYKKIIQEYLETPRGLEIPVYIAQYYKVKSEPEKMAAALQEAIAHYQALAVKHADSALAYRAQTLVAGCYLALKDWQSAINMFNAIVRNYKGKVKMDGILMNMALIYNNELKDKVKSQETLEKLIKEYPESRLVKTATAMLKEWEKK